MSILLSIVLALPGFIIIGGESVYADDLWFIQEPISLRE